jgi:mRNA interferase MazF
LEGPAFPQRGEVWHVDFGVPIGSEAGYRRYALIVSNDLSNEHSGAVIVAAITRDQGRDYPWDVSLDPGDPLPQPSRIQCNQLRTISKQRLETYRDTLRWDQMAQVDVALRVALELV